MKVSELFRRLSFAELSNLAIGGEGSGNVNEASYAKLILYTNEALLRLHSRFLLIEKPLVIVQYQHITNYHLKVRFAEASQSKEPYHYIKDMVSDPFLGDVVKILRVFDATGQERPINDTENPLSVFTPQPNILQVPVPDHGRPLVVSYQARHRPLDDLGENILKQEFELPFFLEGALQSFVAHKVFKHMNGQDNLVTSQQHEATYESICMDVDAKDLVNNTTSTSHHKLETRGFV